MTLYIIISLTLKLEEVVVFFALGEAFKAAALVEVAVAVVTARRKPLKVATAVEQFVAIAVALRQTLQAGGKATLNAELHHRHSERHICWQLSFLCFFHDILFDTGSRKCQAFITD